MTAKHKAAGKKYMAKKKSPLKKEWEEENWWPQIKQEELPNKS